jgi:ABC-2 type transport system permease protein
VSSFVPDPGGAPLPTMVRAQAGLELRMVLRNGEQLLLTLIVPLLLLGVVGSLDVIDLGTRGDRLDFLVPGVLALAVMSTAFTGLAIATGFERRYGALKRLGASPLPRSGLLAAKLLAVLAVEVLQAVLIIGLGLAFGWRPTGGATSAAGAVVLVLLGTLAFGSLGLLMAGTLRAEATLAAANLVYLLLLVAGGLMVPLDRFPDRAAGILELLPSAALADGLRDTLSGGSLPGSAVVVLLAWAAAAGGLAARTFRWE